MFLEPYNNNNNNSYESTVIADQAVLSIATRAPIELLLCSESILASLHFWSNDVNWYCFSLQVWRQVLLPSCKFSMCLKASPLGIGFQFKHRMCVSFDAYYERGLKKCGYLLKVSAKSQVALKWEQSTCCTNGEIWEIILCLVEQFKYIRLCKLLKRVHYHWLACTLSKWLEGEKWCALSMLLLGRWGKADYEYTVALEARKNKPIEETIEALLMGRRYPWDSCTVDEWAQS